MKRMRALGNKSGFTIIETIAAVFMLAVFSLGIFSSVLSIRQMVQSSSQLDSHSQVVHEIADAIVTALQQTTTANDTLGSYSLTQTDYNRLSALTGAYHVESFSYNAQHLVQYKVSLKTAKVYKTVMVDPFHTQQIETTVIIGFTVTVRSYFGNGTNQFAENIAFSNLRGGEWNVK